MSSIVSNKPSCLYLTQEIDGGLAAFHRKSPMVMQAEKTLAATHDLFHGKANGPTLWDMIETQSRHHGKDFELVIIASHGSKAGLQGGPKVDSPDSLKIPSYVKCIIFLSCESDELARATSAANQIACFGCPGLVLPTSLVLFNQNHQIIPLHIRNGVPFTKFAPDLPPTPVPFSFDEMHPDILPYHQFLLSERGAQATHWLERGLQQGCMYSAMATLLNQVLTAKANIKELDSLRNFDPKLLKLIQQAADEGVGPACRLLGEYYVLLENFDTAELYFSKGVAVMDADCASHLRHLQLKKKLRKERESGPVPPPPPGPPPSAQPAGRFQKLIGWLASIWSKLTRCFKAA